MTHKIRPVGAEMLHADGRTDRQHGANSYFLQFRERAYRLILIFCSWSCHTCLYFGLHKCTNFGGIASCRLVPKFVRHLLTDSTVFSCSSTSLVRSSAVPSLWSHSSYIRNRLLLPHFSLGNCELALGHSFCSHNRKCIFRSIKIFFCWFT
jgi:hypothetical protein